MIIDLKSVKPRNQNKSDKYSSNLYKFLNRLMTKGDTAKYIANQLEVHYLHASRWDGEYKEFDPNKIDTMQLLILPLGVNHGRSLYFMNNVLRGGKQTEFALVWKKEEMTDITEWFFDTYKQDGRCLFDRGHDKWVLGDENRFSYTGNTRKCNWCGEWQEKRIEKEVKIKRVENWVAQ